MRAKDDVIFKGTKSGVLVILNDGTDFATLKQRLLTRLAEAERFFYAGAGVTLDVGARILTSEQLLELERILATGNGLRLVGVVHNHSAGAPDVSDPARGGEAAVAEAAAAPPPERNWWGGTPEQRRLAARAWAVAQAGPVATTGRAAPGRAAEPAAMETVLIKRTLRSGQQVRHDGNVVILGDVNPGAEVVASGDIIVMGVLRGVAWAGAKGNPSAVVAAFRLQPTQLRIAHLISRPPDGQPAASAQPEVAHVRGSTIIIDAYPAHILFEGQGGQ